jgi:acetylornithine deacetylase
MLSDVDLLSRLVAFESVSGRGNLPIADFVCDYLERPGVRIERHPGPDETRVNVLAVAGPADRGGGLTTSGHLDVVPAGEEGWSSDPFELTERDGSLYGRGACDMKGSIALFMNAMAAASPPRLAQPLALLLTCDEELGSLGAQRFCRDLPCGGGLPRDVLVGEPTSLQAVRMHKGHLTMRVVVRGRSAHSGSPHLGDNAISCAVRVVEALDELASRMRGVRCETSSYFPDVPFPVLNVGRIAGGDTVNVVPDRCTIELGVRLLPGMSVQEAADGVTAAVAERAPGATVQIVNDNPPLLLEEDAHIHRTLCGLLGQSRSCGVSFASDGGVLARCGFRCVLFGPGSIETAHRPDEHVPVGELRGARRVLEELIRRRCG